MQTIQVVSKTGKKLMPSTRPGRIRHLLKEAKAEIVRRNPFTVRLLYDSTEYTQINPKRLERCAENIS